MPWTTKGAVVGVWAICLALSLWLEPFGYDLRLEQFTAMNLDDPYRRMPELATYPGPWIPWHNPRPPAALLLNWPLRFISPDAIPFLTAVFFPTAFVAATVLSLRIAQQPILPGILTAPLWLASFPVRMGLETGNLSILVIAAVLLAWKIRGSGGAALLGLAGAVRLWPLVLLIPMFRGQRKQVLIGIGTAGLVTGLALLHPGIHIAGTLEVLQSTEEFRDSRYNLSLGLGIVGAILLGLLSLWLTLERMVPLTLLLSPVTWPHYLPVLGPLTIRRWPLVLGLWMVPLFDLDNRPLLKWPLIAAVLVCLAQAHQIFRRHTPPGLSE